MSKNFSFLPVLFMLIVTGCGGGGGAALAPDPKIGQAVSPGAPAVMRQRVRIQLPSADRIRGSSALIRRQATNLTINRYRLIVKQGDRVVATMVGRPGEVVEVDVPLGLLAFIIEGVNLEGQVLARGQLETSVAAGQTSVEVTIEVNWLDIPATVTIVPPGPVISQVSVNPRFIEVYQTPVYVSGIATSEVGIDRFWVEIDKDNPRSPFYQLSLALETNGTPANWSASPGSTGLQVGRYPVTFVVVDRNGRETRLAAGDFEVRAPAVNLLPQVNVKVIRATSLNSLNRQSRIKAYHAVTNLEWEFVDASGAQDIEPYTWLVVGRNSTFVRYEVENEATPQAVAATHSFSAEYGTKHPQWQVFAQPTRHSDMFTQTNCHVYGVTATGQRKRLTSSPFRTGREYRAFRWGLYILTQGYSRIWPLNGEIEVTRGAVVHVSKDIPGATAVRVFDNLSNAELPGFLTSHEDMPNTLMYRLNSSWSAENITYTYGSRLQYYYKVLGANGSELFRSSFTTGP